MANQYTKAKDNQRKEIIWNIINSLLAGGLVFLGSILTGISWQGFVAALATSGIVAINKFKDYWTKEEKEYCQTKLFKFV
jgi:hypothetical protein